MSNKIYELKIQLEGVSKPPIWRKVEVEATATLEDLHALIQDAMGWEHAHLYQFIIGRTYYSMPYDPDDADDFDGEKASEVLLSAAFGDKIGANIKYEYDFGDGWLHKVSLEAISEAQDGLQYPILLSGKGACPPENCGGVWGYESLKETLKNPKSPDYKDMLSWLGLKKGSDFDAEDFDLKEARKRL